MLEFTTTNTQEKNVYASDLKCIYSLYMLNHPLWLNKKKYLQFKTLKLEQTHKKL